MIYTIDQIKEAVVRPLVSIGVTRIGLFGSYAKGVATEESDIDLLVLNPDEFDFLDYMDLRESLQEKMGKKIDYIEYRCISKYLEPEILSTEVLLYDKG